MPMFEDDTGLAQGGKPFQQELRGQKEHKEQSDYSSRQSPSPPNDRPNTPSKPIAIPAPSSSPYNGRRMSEESIRTELCEGPVSTGPSPLPLSFGARPSQGPNERHDVPPRPRPSTPPSRDSASITDRAELIDRIKRGESPAWVPNRHVSKLELFEAATDSATESALLTWPLQLENIFHKQTSQSPTRSPRTPSSGTPTPTNLLPAADITPERIPLDAQDQDAHFSARLEDGLNIERPRSALHSGDFTLTSSARRQNQQQQRPRPLSNEVEARAATILPSVVQARPSISGSEFHADSCTPWVATSPPRHYTPFALDHRATPSSSLADTGIFRSTAPSPPSSISSSFVYKPPTSPLVQSQNNYDDDDDDDDDNFPLSSVDGTFGGSPTNAIDNLRANTRRHTLTFSHFNYSQSSPFSTPYPAHSPSSRFSSATIRRDSHYPYQAHQPRRSLSTTQSFGADRSVVLHTASTPHTPMLSRSRRPSFTLDASPLQHASMVGSYEESILRGRMSTTPSKPLDFLAQIGVLGLGAKCKPSLRCPAHVTLPFSAVFYSYSTTSHGRTEAEDGPSPYVGMLDLENGLPNAGVDLRSKRKAMMPSRRATSSTRVGVLPDAPKPKTSMEGTGNDMDAGDDTVMEDVHVERLDLSDTEPQKPSSGASRAHKRRPHGARAPPGGSYRIPQQGQLQIIIKNQNKTAVKLFLIPYDLSTMEPGTKTFIRQRSYSGGPIIDSVPALKDPSADRPILRYLVHLHICCPSRGRYYLYKSIRVVFANRVPDGKEKLRNEVTFPEPRYTPYKPVRVMHPPVGIAGGSGYQAGGNDTGASLAAEKAFRRRSSGFTFTGHGPPQVFDVFGIQGNAGDVPAVPLIPNPLPTWRAGWESKKAPSAAPPLALDKSDLAQTALCESPTLALKREKVTESNYTGPTRDGASSETSILGPNTLELGSTTPVYKKLSKGDIGYGGNAFLSGSSTTFDGLLSQRLRSLEAEKKLTAGTDPNKGDE
ncbi:hypothetical protein F503_02931 [Ophiostoma piceae UAMH 11346]|uniref:Atos-like conserved domain-containing protein n=1 Tax=Ophiostoma piceae (strain UAMH 11346) TaxID=1262450 RepID=S3BZZ4_OPHP1|nr:hypothetical protein F503_02931 [Ophiostoma piceae UAMH 11346]